jgi:hypothetical protein
MERITPSDYNKIWKYQLHGIRNDWWLTAALYFQLKKKLRGRKEYLQTAILLYVYVKT